MSYLGNSADALYAIKIPEPDSGELARVDLLTTLQGCDGILDIAMNRAGELYATSPTALYTVDVADGACNIVAKGSYPESITFAPAGAVTPGAEALVGYSGSTYLRIDPFTGAVTPLGGLGAGITSTGDLAAFPSGEVFVIALGEGCDSCLYRVDPQTGAFAEAFDPPEPNVAGLAYDEGGLYAVLSPIGVRWFSTTSTTGVVGKVYSFYGPNEEVELRGATTVNW